MSGVPCRGCRATSRVVRSQLRMNSTRPETREGSLERAPRNRQEQSRIRKANTSTLPLERL
eukprot:5396827-Prymnesium_polylepis.1